jgi:hypothetical protein
MKTAMVQTRVDVMVATILGVIGHAVRQFLHGEPVNIAELREAITQYLREELRDAERQFRADQPPVD